MNIIKANILFAKLTNFEYLIIEYHRMNPLSTMNALFLKFHILYIGGKDMPNQNLAVLVMILSRDYSIPLIKTKQAIIVFFNFSLLFFPNELDNISVSTEVIMSS